MFYKLRHDRRARESANTGGADTGPGSLPQQALEPPATPALKMPPGGKTSIMNSLARVVLSPARALGNLVGGIVRWVLHRDVVLESGRDTAVVQSPHTTEASVDLAAARADFERRALSVVEGALGGLTERLGTQLEKQLEEQAATLSDSLASRIDRLGEAMDTMNHAALGRADLLHTEIDRLRDSVESRLDGVERDNHGINRTLGTLQALTTRLGHEWTELARNFEEEFAVTNGRIREFREEINTRFDCMSTRHQQDMELTRAAQDRQRQEGRESHQLLAKSLNEFASRLGRVAQRFNRMTFETEELLGIGRGEPGRLGRLIHWLTLPFTALRGQRRAIRQSIDLQRFLIGEMVEFKNDLQSLSQDFTPAADPDAGSPELSSTAAGGHRFDPALLDDGRADLSPRFARDRLPARNLH